MTLQQNVEDYLHSLPPTLWLIYHVNLKAIQVGSMAGVTAFILKAPVLIQSAFSTKSIKANNDNDEYYTVRRLRKHLLQAFVCAIMGGMTVTLYNWITLRHDVLEDRVYRIIHAPYQKQIDYSVIMGGLLGFAYAFKTLDVIPKQLQIKLSTDGDKSNAKDKNDTDVVQYYKAVSEYVICNGLIGVGCGVMFHVIRTRHFTPPRRIWMYTTQCWA
eukprot:220108_1